MELEDRLKKVATGISVGDALDAYMRELSGESAQEPEEDARTSELLAIVEIMFLMAAVDGDVAPIEMRQLRRSIEALPDIRATAGLRLDNALVEIAEKLGREGWDRRLEEASAALHTSDTRSFAYRLAAGIAFVDDFVAHDEAAALDKLAGALGLDSARSQAILREVRAALFGA